MSGGVGQRLLDDAEERGLQRDRQTSSTLGQGELDGQALLPLVALRILLQRRDQAKLVEDGRAEVVDQAADVLDVGLREVSQFLELLRRSGIGLDQLAGGAEVEGGEGGADAIVQLAGDALAFILLGAPACKVSTWAKTGSYPKPVWTLRTGLPPLTA
jgi:hypothetical protein